MNKNIIVFGGGLAGLTVCHELINKGFNIILVEKDNLLGGMARSRREKNNVPSEHSWRGYAPFYKNTFNLIRTIPYKNVSVYENLSNPINFDTLQTKKLTYNLKDIIILIYYCLILFVSDKRRKEYYKIKINSLLKRKLTYNTHVYLMNFVCGPGYGLEKKDASFAHFFKFIGLTIFNSSKYKEKLNDRFIHNPSDAWHVMNQPTSEAWIDPWSDYLKLNNVKILLNTDLIQLNYNNNLVESCLIKNNLTNEIEELIFDEYILCINPFEAEKILKISNMNKLYKYHYLLNIKTISNQPSFRLGFKKPIKFPKENIAFSFSYSNLDITLYPQEQVWGKNIKLDDNNTIKSLWSGTCIDMYSKCKLYNKIGLELTRTELINEIIYQILEYKIFQELIFDNNNFYLTKDDIIYTEIWYEWPTEKKWVNNIYNEKYRINNKTEFTNLYIGGAHTKTTINIWSMEGAIESGKSIAQIIDIKYNNNSDIFLFKHKENNFFKIFKFLDNVLYKLKLPNLVNLILFIIIIFIIKYIIKYI